VINQFIRIFLLGNLNILQEAFLGSVASYFHQFP